MPLSKARDRERKRKERKRQRDAYLLGVSGSLSPADVRAMRAAGLKPEELGDEVGTVPSSQFYALLRDRDAIKAHLSWHHDMVGKPDPGTMFEQLQARVTLLEAERVLDERL